MSAPAKRQPIPFGEYLLLDRINIGGMAEVWRGKSFGAGGFERLVAIKRILPNIAEDKEFVQMFEDEAKITVQLTHANIAQVQKYDRIGSSHYIAMEYVPGKDVRAIFDRCRKKGEPAPIPLTCYLVARMCEGLDYAHRKKDGMGRDLNIVHRDISPQNVLVSYEGEVKVIDFGIAKAAGKAVKTQAGILKGKFAYMSPEQIRGLPLDRRSDVFAIGICLYELLTGERLFVGESDFSVLEKVRKAEVLPPSTFNRRIPEALEKIVLKALARDVEDRYQYASDLADDLQKFLITSDSIFSRKDLMQYMKSTFAEDVEREKRRIQEYAAIKPTEGMQAALDLGLSAPAPTPVRRLTAAAPMLSDQQDDASGATVLVDGRTWFNEPPDSPTLTKAAPVVRLRSESVPATPPNPVPPEDEEASGLTTPSRRAGQLQPEDSTVDTAVGPTPPASHGSQDSGLKVLAGVAVAVLLVLVGVGWVLLKGPGEGNLYIRLPKELAQKARVNLGGTELDPARVRKAELLEKVPAGRVAVMVAADGWKTYTGTIDVKAGGEVTRFEPQLERRVETTQLIVISDPEDAEVRIDGQVVKKLGDPSGPYVGEIPVGSDTSLEVRSPGHKPFAKKLTAESADAPVKVPAKLDPLEE